MCTVFQRYFTATRIDAGSSLVCTTCLTECIAASGAVSCPCCSDDDLSHVRPASNGILLCCYQIEDIVLVAVRNVQSLFFMVVFSIKPLWDWWSSVEIE